MNFLEPLQIKIKTVAGMQSLLKHYRSGIEMTRIIARTNRLTEDPIWFMDRLQRTTLFFVRPKFGADPHLAFPATQRVAPWVSI